MKYSRFIWAAGLAALVYWLVLYAATFRDWYLDWPVAGMALKLLLPLVLIVNLGAVAIIVVGFKAGSRRRNMTALSLHALPVLAGVGLLYWLFFGVSI